MRLSLSGQGLLITSLVLVLWWGPDAPRLVQDVTGPSFPDALVALGSLLALAVAAWVLLAAALVSAGASSRLVAHTTPTFLRGVLVAGAVGVVAIAPAHADRAFGPDSRLLHSVDGLTLPDRPDGARTVKAATPALDGAAEAGPPSVVTVQPGDTLWAIAARALPHEASDARIARATRSWHATNRAVIGDDPDRIVPGQHLVPPSGKDHP